MHYLLPSLYSLVSQVLRFHAFKNPHWEAVSGVPFSKVDSWVSGVMFEAVSQ